jgi:hypothetical protein
VGLSVIASSVFSTGFSIPFLLILALPLSDDVLKIFPLELLIDCATVPLDGLALSNGRTFGFLTPDRGIALYVA